MAYKRVNAASPGACSVPAGMDKPFSIKERPELVFDSQADAAQEAEFLHTETNRVYRVLHDGEVCYESQGAPA